MGAEGFAVPEADDLAVLREQLAPEPLRELALRLSGVDVENTDELARLAALGLTLRVWRNTELESAHGGSAARVVGKAEASVDDEAAGDDQEPAAVAVWREGRRLRAQADHAEMALLRAEPTMSEFARLRLLRAQLKVGDGIPDDVMFRINASTSADLEEVVREALDSPPSDLTDWLAGVAGSVWDPDRELVVGDCVWHVREIYDALDVDPWDDDEGIPDQARHATSRLCVFGNLVGFEGLIRFLGVAGSVSCHSWAGTPWWPTIVERLAAHAASIGDPWTDEDVQTLLREPASVRGPVAEDRVTFHWATHIEDEAFREFHVERLLAAGLEVDKPTSVPIWLVL